MDLRPYVKTRRQLELGIDSIRRGVLFYQLFILADDMI